MSELIQKLINVVPSLASHSKDSIPLILDECKRQEVTNKAQIAYILATARHESGLGKWMEEIASGSKYEWRASLGNNQKGDGVKFKGRGFVQITGRNNYKNYSKILGIDLLSNPKRASEKGIASKILVDGMKNGRFTGVNLNKYINENGNDFINARRIVNGTDMSAQIAGYAEQYYQVLKNSNSISSKSTTKVSSKNGIVAIVISSIVIGYFTIKKYIFPDD